MKTKLAIFDFDGTLTTSGKGGNCWRYVWERINKPDIDDKLYKDFLDKKIDYFEWADLVVQEYRKSGVDSKILKDISNKIKLRDGVKETFAILKSQGVKIYILSGGIKNIVEDCLQDSLPYIEKIEAQDFELDEKGVVKKVIHLSHNIENKFEYITLLKNQLNLKGDEIFFMGNADNDESAHGAGVRTLCVNPDRTDPYDKNYWDFYIEDIQNLQEILPFVE